MEEKKSRARRIIESLKRGKFPEAKREAQEGIEEWATRKPSKPRQAAGALASAAVDLAVPEDATDVLATAVPPAKLAKGAVKAAKRTGKISRRAPSAKMSPAQRKELDDLRSKSRSRGLNDDEKKRLRDLYAQAEAAAETLTYE